MVNAVTTLDFQMILVLPSDWGNLAKKDRETSQAVDMIVFLWPLYFCLCWRITYPLTCRDLWISVVHYVMKCDLWVDNINVKLTFFFWSLLVIYSLWIFSEIVNVIVNGIFHFKVFGDSLLAHLWWGAFLEIYIILSSLFMWKIFIKLKT